MTNGELEISIRGLIQEQTRNFYTEVSTWINDASFEATKDVGFPWKEKTQAATEDQADYDLPDDFIALEPMLPAYFDGERIYKKSLSQLIEKDPNYRSASSGIPDTYYIYLPDKISLYVPPNSTDDFIYPYIYKEATMTEADDTTLISERYPDLIIFKVVELCAMKASDGSTNCERKIARCENKYINEVAKVRSELAVLLHGDHETTLVG